MCICIGKTSNRQEGPLWWRVGKFSTLVRNFVACCCNFRSTLGSGRQYRSDPRKLHSSGTQHHSDTSQLDSKQPRIHTRQLHSSGTQHRNDTSQLDSKQPRIHTRKLHSIGRQHPSDSRRLHSSGRLHGSSTRQLHSSSTRLHKQIWWVYLHNQIMREGCSLIGQF
jgi:hypothetical protein